MPSDSDPETEYERRLNERQQAVDACARQSDRVAVLRGMTFLAAVVLGFGAWNSSVAVEWILVPGLVFLALIVVHDDVERRLALARRAVRHYRAGLDRLHDRWSGQGPDGSRYLDPAHPYAGDLDVFGRGSLYQLLCRARTRLGEDTLARWLSQGADAPTVEARQQAVEELRPALDLRERIALLDAEVHDDLDQTRLLRWAREVAAPMSLAPRLTAVVLAVAASVSLVAWLSGRASLLPLMLALTVEFVFLSSFGKRIKAAAKEADEAASGLMILSRVLRVMEEQRPESPLLRELVGRLQTEGRPPSRWIASLHQRIHFLTTSLQNQVFAAFALLLCLPVHFVHAIEVWRQHVGPQIPEWLNAVGEFEAISSLAGHAYEHPEDPFPELASGGPCFEGEGISHPLLPARTCVRNDVALGGERRVLLVSGSNMSGKSTLLRTVGTNVVLALAGAPVRARRLVLSPLQVGTEMRVHDSLQQGQSLFFAVISRLKQIVDLARGTPPLLFLLDEILQGTNSHDRRLGAEGVIRTLVDSGAIGIVTTHDLALTTIVAGLNGRAANIHFEDRLEDGKMTFDYRIRPGVVQRSNALELMRLIGLAPRTDSEESGPGK